MNDQDDAEGLPYWFAAGDGDPMLFVHGSGGNAAAWWQQTEHFSQSHRVIAFDHAGFGRSAPFRAERMPGLFAEDALRVLDAAGVERATLVCQSLGGWTGVRLALEHPDRVQRLVLCCTMAGIAHPPAIASFMAAAQRMDARGPAALGLTDAFRAANPAKAYLYEQIGAFNRNFDPNAMAGIFASDVLVPLDRLAAISCPVLLIAGALDPIWPPEVLAAIAEALPAARLDVIPEAGHSPYLEQPGALNRLIEAFMAQPG